MSERNLEDQFVAQLGNYLSKTPRAELNFYVIDNSQGLPRIQAHIIEQNLINVYGINKNGLLFNKINSIPPRYWDRWGIIINF